MHDYSKLDELMAAIRAMGCAVVVLTAEDIQSCGPHHDNDEPVLTHNQAEKWLRDHMREVEEAILGDYWAEPIYVLLNDYPIEETADA